MRNCRGWNAQAGAAAKPGVLSVGLSPKLTASTAKAAQCALIVLTLVAANVPRVLAQQPPAAPEQSQPQEPSSQGQTGQNQSSQDQPKQEPANSTLANQAASAALKPVELFNTLQKKSIVFPDIAANTIALSPGQKFQLFVDDSVSVDAFVESILGSLIGQAEDSPTGFGEGGAAYGKRFGSSLARESSGNFFGTFVLASALHEDPRFVPHSKPSLKGSMKYSVKMLFVTRNDSGKNVANVPLLVGDLLGEGLANAYWPQRNRTVGDTLFRYGIDLAERAGGNMFRDYWPVIVARLGRAAAPRKGSQ
jgi:hypothetical protein